MEDTNFKCFVCEKEINTEIANRNIMVNLPVCERCKGTTKEKKSEEEFLDSLADGLICGCI